MPTRPITGPLTRSPSGGVTGVGALSGGLPALSATKYAIQEDASDVNILVVGDSTGNATDEWVYLFGQWLATQHPTHSVSYRLWNDAGNVYDAAVVLGTGSGANTIRIWNASISGSAAEYLLGSKFNAAVASTAAHLVVFSYGHNQLTSTGAEAMESALITVHENVQLQFPSASVVALTQNPRRDDNNMAMAYAAIRTVASDKPGFGVIDTYAKFIEAGKNGSLYTDNVHPSASGTALYVDSIKAQWRASPAVNYPPPPAWLASSATNLLTNGDFSSFAGATPTGWSVGGATAVTKDAAIVDGAGAYSCKVENASGGGLIFQTLSAGTLNSVKGGYVCLAARVRLPASGSTNQGRLMFNLGAGGFPGAGGLAGAREGFFWQVFRVSVPENSTALEPRCYGANNSTIGEYAHYSKVVLVAGRYPRNMV